MPTSGGGFEQSDNAQASVDVDTGLIVSAHVTQQSNDQQEVDPTLAQLSDQSETIGQPITLFLLRGLKAVTGEWNLLCIAFNLKKLHTLAG